MTRTRLVLGVAIVVELTALWFSRPLIKAAGDDIYWWLWSVAPMPPGVERPHRPR
jgi:hypothetical protein